uniref:Uncharacterized protein n=1 Tax=Fusarium oxysporum (strain Fo5176) TaxID=660025 RepID=A0A0D2Y459_FUSOF
MNRISPNSKSGSRVPGERKPLSSHHNFAPSRNHHARSSMHVSEPMFLDYEWIRYRHRISQVHNKTNAFTTSPQLFLSKNWSRLVEVQRELNTGDFLHPVPPFAGCFVRLSIFVSKNLLSSKLMLKIATPYIFRGLAPFPPLHSAPDMEARQDEDCHLSSSGRLREVVLSTDCTVERLPILVPGMAQTVKRRRKCNAYFLIERDACEAQPALLSSAPKG